MRWSPLVLLLVSACTAAAPRSDGPRAPDERGQPPVQEVFAYRACEFSAPGELVALPREVAADREPVAAAIGELLEGVTEPERARGCRSFFSSRTENALRDVRLGAGGDTLFVDFRDFSEAIPDTPGAKSFLPPGVMGELTWTIFQQFPHIEAVRFSFAGDESAFWSWLAGEGTQPRAYTRSMWERT